MGLCEWWLSVRTGSRFSPSKSLILHRVLVIHLVHIYWFLTMETILSARDTISKTDMTSGFMDLML